MKTRYVIDSVEGCGVALPVLAVTRVLPNAGVHVEVFAFTRRDGRALGPILICTSLPRATVIGLLIGKRRAIPVVCWQHSAFLKPIRRLLLYLLRKRPAMWIGDSDMVAALTAKRFDVPPERLASWPLLVERYAGLVV